MGGEEALKPKARSGGKKKRLPQTVTDKIVETKKKHPTFGIKRISDVQKRWFCLSASPETVRNRLHEEGLMDPPTKKKPKRNMTRPRFFERAPPNQLWQTKSSRQAANCLWIAMPSSIWTSSMCRA